ncbi:MAG: hypothetical protein KKD07_05405 [Candidatus Omnitrophica bacterium]|nr:hypothetical protein [Candidatus Omnitrophota bacterium]MBU1997605.1 hypothetical protein [Candidatus Omnitrophota bacterium]MBU4333857.1 hypothetical protein [Candidatus Omnitrophota bacterium]
MTQKRAVCLNCIDGRVQLPVINWIMGHHKVDYVDMITEPGMDGLLADNNNPIEEINRKIRISIKNNNANMIFVVGHHDCRANPVKELVHKDQILMAVKRLKPVFSEMPIKGIWVNSEWKIVQL